MKKDNKPLKFTELSMNDLRQATNDIATVITEDFIKQDRFLTEDEIDLQIMLAKAMLFRFRKVFGHLDL